MLLQYIMKIIVVGTGFASIPAISLLVKLGFKPTVIDVGNKINNKKKHLMKKDIFIKKKNYDDYLCLGGLSNVWTGVIDKYDEIDLQNWPVNKNILENYYNKLDDLLYKSEIYNFISKKNSLLNYQIKKNQESEDKLIQSDKNLLFKNTSILTSEFENNSQNDNLYFNLLKPLNFSEYIEKLINESKINYVRGKVINMQEKKDSVEVINLDPDNNKKIYKCDYLFLGCGSASTLKLIQNSLNNFDKNLKLKNNKKIVFPVYFKQKEKIKNNKENFYNIYPIFQLHYKSKNLGNIYSQISNLNITLFKYLFPNFSNSNIFQNISNFFNKFGFSYLSLDSRYGDEFTFDKNGEIIIYKKNISNNFLIKNLNDLFNNNILSSEIKHIKFPIFRNSLSGNHFGSSFPMKKIKKNIFDSDIFGRTADYKKISILDSSIFTTLSAKPPTFTIMANSYRIVDNVLIKNFFN